MSSSTPAKTRKSGYLATKSYTANTLMLVGIGYFMIPIVWVVVNSTKNNTDLLAHSPCGFPRSGTLWRIFMG